MKDTDADPMGGRRTTQVVIAGVLLAAGAWSYWPVLSDLWEFWQVNADYSVGQLVPLVAIWMVWSYRHELGRLPAQVCWWGLLVLLISQVIRLAGLYYWYGSLERYSIVLAVVGVVLLVWGRQVARRLAWVFLFLVLMVPLPGRVHRQVAVPLQSFATTSAVFCLDMTGYLVARQGNDLFLSDRTSVTVAEACNGLRMLTAFTVVAAALAFVVRGQPWQKAVIVLSSIPVAILANTLRLVATLLLHEWFGGEVAKRFFHDFAGWSMMPAALIILLAEFRLLRWIAQPEPKRAGLGVHVAG